GLGVLLFPRSPRIDRIHLEMRPATEAKYCLAPIVVIAEPRPILAVHLEFPGALPGIVRCAATLALSFAGSAAAADLPVKIPISAPVPAFTWTGCYLGANAGAASLNPAWNRTSSFDAGRSGGAALLPGGFDSVSFSRGDDFNFNAIGAVGGGQVGCNYQLAC